MRPPLLTLEIRLILAGELRLVKAVSTLFRFSSEEDSFLGSRRTTWLSLCEVTGALTGATGLERTSEKEGVALEMRDFYLL
ncbi:hypothetical protein AVEN_175418-1 [Araneus ventricosus]|uniref:Uncharacterized protein n=1 Tax=Araneus ventricosus TaxID=182803 RepID=A0A4Y2MTM3_ARAVE|nr:hypothetical protein AVEN_175418-1 [Araneus ventricosus]